MPVVSPSQRTDRPRAQAPWDRRNPGELSQTSFRTTLRGFDRDQVRAVLERVAADYRVLQMQNASLKRQLEHLEGVLQTYQHHASSPHGAPGDAPPPIHAHVHDHDQPAARVTAHPPAVRHEPSPSGPRERDANGIRIVAHTLEQTLKRIDAELLAVPALRCE